jgi:hypothetical protein
MVDADTSHTTFNRSVGLYWNMAPVNPVASRTAGQTTSFSGTPFTAMWHTVKQWFDGTFGLRLLDSWASSSYRRLADGDGRP